MIRVVGILMIIFGGIGIGLAISNLEDYSYIGAFIGGGFGILGYYELLVNAAMLAVGILAAAKAPIKDVANQLFVFAIVLIGLYVIYLLWFIIGLGELFSFVFESMGAQFVISALGGFITPVLLTVGANTRKKAHI